MQEIAADGRSPTHDRSAMTRASASRRPIAFLCALLGAALALGTDASAQTGERVKSQTPSETKAEEEEQSPWLIAPLFSSDPKLGTSFGLILGYVHYFDEESRPSTFGINGQYTTTGSAVVAAFANTSFREDHHRITALVAGGEIKNDYNDYLGTGMPLKSNDHLRAFALRYLYRVVDDWFIGGQLLDTNYLVTGQDASDQQVLDILGIKGFESGGLGVLAYHDSRDSESSPTQGWLLNANNIAYRDWVAGDANFDVYRLDFRDFFGHGDGNVFALRQNNQWTVDAPAAAFAPVKLRGYKLGQYLGQYMSSIEIEERFRLAKRWTTTIFTGVASLYGGGLNAFDSANLYPDVGAGLQYVLRPKEGMVMNLEFAAGKNDNYGFYIKFGYGF
jgi:hypothetical protein